MYDWREAAKQALADLEAALEAGYQEVEGVEFRLLEAEETLQEI